MCVGAVCVVRMPAWQVCRRLVSIGSSAGMSKVTARLSCGCAVLLIAYNLMNTAIRQQLASRSRLTSTRCRKAPTPQTSLVRLKMFSDAGYSDRFQAGEQLGIDLKKRLRDEKPENIVVLGLVRGGLPVAEPVALALNAPLDAFISRKIGSPYQPE